MPQPPFHDLAIATAAAREAGRVAQGLQAGIGSTAKSDGSPVTPGDLAADAVIRHVITTHFPGDAILSEEVADDPARLANGRVWIVDPIDGTKDYAAGGPSWAVQLALAVDGVLTVGVLDMPGLGVSLTGMPGHGATITTAAEGTRALTSPGSPCTTLIASSSTRNAATLARLRTLLPEFAVTTCTSVGVKVLHLLRGEADLYVHGRPINEWDVAAPAAVLAAAGGWTSDLAGGALRYNRRDPRCPGLVFSTRDDCPDLIRRLDAGGLRSE